MFCNGELADHPAFATVAEASRNARRLKRIYRSYHRIYNVISSNEAASEGRERA